MYKLEGKMIGSKQKLGENMRRKKGEKNKKNELSICGNKGKIKTQKQTEGLTENKFKIG